MPTTPLFPKTDDDVLEIMNDVVRLSAPTGRDSRGRLVYAGPTISYRGKVEYEVKQIRTNTGEEAASNCTIYLAPVVVNANDSLTHLSDLPTITPEYKITLPDETSPIILRVDKNYFEDLSHVIIYL